MNVIINESFILCSIIKLLFKGIQQNHDVQRVFSMINISIQIIQTVMKQRIKTFISYTAFILFKGKFA